MFKIKRSLSLLCAVLAVASAFTLIFSDHSGSERKIAEDDNASGYRYIVREYNGKIAVFEADNTSPVEILDCLVKNLPESDKNKLIKGIEVEDEGNLQQLIEAFD